MTIVVERPLADEPTVSARRPSRRGSWFSRWRLAARLARREVRRRPGRTALVAALIAVPVVGMTIATVVASTTNDPWAEQFARRGGTADVMVHLPTVPAPTDAELAATLPAGSTWVRSHNAHGPITLAGELDSAYVMLTDLDLAAPVAAGVVDVTEGAAPAAGEVLLSRGLADDFDLGVGDTLELARPAGRWTVSGVGRLADFYDTPLVVAGRFDFDRVRPEYRTAELRIDLPPGTDVAQATADLRRMLPAASMVETAAAELGAAGPGGVDPRALAWGWVAGTIALAAVGIVIAAAFATSARRQLATIGQLSANGATAGLVRRTLALQGSWSGLIGAAAGLGASAILLWAGRPLVDLALGHDVGPYEVEPINLLVIAATAVVAATGAALVPARSAARVPVLAALAGRRPLGALPRRLVPLGLTVFAAGLALLLVAAATGRNTGGNLPAAVATIGGLAVLGGMCAVSPFVVDALRRVPARGSWRLAARGLVRQRTRSAAVVTAIATVGATAIAGATFARQLDDVEPVDAVPTLPSDTVLVRPQRVVDRPQETPSFRLPADLEAELAAIVPGARLVPWRIPAVDADDAFLSMYAATDLVIADTGVLDTIGLSDRDRRVLRERGVLLMHDWGMPVAEDGTVMPVVPTVDGAVRLDAIVRRDLPRTWGGHIGMLITAEHASKLGWRLVDGPVAVHASRPLTASQRSALAELDPVFWEADDPYVAEVGSAGAGEPWSWHLEYDQPAAGPTRTQVEGLIVAAALLLTLAVVAIGLALAASEGRDERDVLVAVGARPATMRRLAGQRAVALAALAATLAVPSGYLPTAIVIRSVDRVVPAFPWLTAGALLAGVPLVAGGVAWLGSAIAQRVRPVRMSTLTLD